MLAILLNVYLVLLVPLRRRHPAAPAPALRHRVVGGLVGSRGRRADATDAVRPWAEFPGRVDSLVELAQRAQRGAAPEFFDNSVPFAILAALIFVVALTIRFTGRWQSAGEIRRMLIICGAWIVIPTAISLIYSAISDPFYYPRYLFFTTPAMAIVLAICIVAITRRPRWIALILVVLAAAAVPNYLLSQRQRYAKEGWDYSDVADVTTAQASPGDCLLVDNTVNWLPGPVRALLSGPSPPPSARWWTSAVVFRHPSKSCGTAISRSG